MKNLVIVVFILFSLISCVTSKPKISNCTNSSLKYIKQVAYNYTPYSGTTHEDFKLPEFSTSYLDTLSCLARKKDKDLEMHLTLIFVKLYHHHIKTNHVSSYVGKEQLTRIYWNYFSEEFKQDNKEYTTSTIGHDWALKNNHLNSNPLIQEQIQLIKKLPWYKLE